jgi:hypothetical protein
VRFYCSCWDQPLSAYWRIAQDPCCINGIEYKKGKIIVKLINDPAHIRWTSAKSLPPRVLKRRGADRVAASTTAAERNAAEDRRIIEPFRQIVEAFEKNSG